MKLEVENITKKYKDKTAVDNVSITFTPGVWGLLGANGAGKTTLMRMIAGIMEPTEGKILYDGVPIETLQGEYRRIFGYLPQEFGFYPEFNVQDYLEYMAALKGMPKREAKRKIDELLEQVSLSEVRKKKIVKLSGGMKRRVGIVQALLNDPEVLILDEPTADWTRESVCVSVICFRSSRKTGLLSSPRISCRTWNISQTRTRS